jgi:hypothetical protein
LSWRSGEGPERRFSPVAMIWPCQLSVEEYAAADKDVAVPRPCCGRCGAPMMFSSGYRRSVRVGATVSRIWVRRCRCGRCTVSDAMLPSFCLVGRLDAVEVIGPALVAVAAGSGTRPVARGIARLFAYTTVRGWWRRHCQRLAWLAEGLSACWELPGGRPVGRAEGLAALEMVGAALSVPVGIGLWSAVSLAVSGAWLATTTDMPTTGGWGWSWMTLMACADAPVPP